MEKGNAMSDQNGTFNDKDRNTEGVDPLFDTESQPDNSTSPIEVMGEDAAQEPQSQQVESAQLATGAQPANSYAQAQPTQQNPYDAAQAQPQGQPRAANPYAQTYAQPVDAAAQARAQQGQQANPYGAPQQAANPYGAPQPQQPASGFGAADAQGAPYAQGVPGGAPYQQPYAGGVGGPSGQVPYGQPYPGATMGGVPQQPAGNGKATAALVCGILAILLSSSIVISVILGIAAIVLAGSYLKGGGTAGTAKAGRICGVVGIVFSAICLMLYLVLGVAVFNEIMDDYKNDTLAYNSSSSTSSGLTSSVYDDQEKAAIDVVNAQMDALKNGDRAILADIAEMVEVDFGEATGVTMPDCGIDSMEYARQMLAGFSYTQSLAVADEKSGGFVSYDVTCKDVFDVLGEFNESMNESRNSSEYSTMTEAQARARVGELFMQAVRDADMEDDAYFSIDVTYENGQWVIDQESWESELDYYFGIY